LGINLIMSLGLHIISGETGMLSVGTGAFMAIGAYTGTVLYVVYNVGFGWGVVAAVLVAATFGVLVGIPSLRLKGDYLLMATFAFAEIVRVTLLNLKITNGALGISGIPGYTNFWWVYGSLAVVVVITLLISSSRMGRALRAIREDEVAAEAMGINSTFYKTLAFAIGSAFAGLAGALYAFQVRFISPNDFSVMLAFIIYLYIVLGGMGNIYGAILGTVILTLVPEYLRVIEDWRMVLYGLFLVIIVIFRPQGILGNLSFRRQRSAKGGASA
jgi:branched-chain amino acid transport system permease protein